MEIVLNEKYRITSDKHNYILQEKRIASSNNPLTKKVGNISYVNLGYFGALEHLVGYLVENEIKSDSTNDLIALNGRLIEVERNITDLLNEAIGNQSKIKGEFECQK